jgi:hypothetical protein
MKNSFFQPPYYLSKRSIFLVLFPLIPLVTSASDAKVPTIGPIRVEFIMFGLILLGVALLHKETFKVAVIGLSVLIIFKLVFDPGFNFLEHLFGQTSMHDQLLNKNLRQGELGIILNLLGLLLGFSNLAKIFEESGIPEALPKYLPNDWHVAVAYVIGFTILLLTMGWEPADNREHKIINCQVPGCSMADNPIVQK